MEAIKNKWPMIKKRLLYIVPVLLLGGFVISNNNKPAEYELFTVAREASLSKEVAATGRVEAADSVELAFENGGKVAQINAKVGQKVAAGKVVASLSNADISAQLAQAQASYESAQAALSVQQAKLDEIRSGSRAEDIAIAQTKLSNAQKSVQDAQANYDAVKNKADLDLANLYSSAPSLVQDAYAKADDALNKQIDDIFTNDTTSNPQLTILVVDSQAKYNAENGRVAAQQAFESLKREVDNLPANTQELESALVRVKGSLTIIRDYMTTVGDAVNAAVGLSSSTQSAYRGNVATARANSVAAVSAVENRIQAIASQKVANINNVTSAQTALNNAQSAVAIAQNELSLRQAGSTGDQIKAQEAYVAQAAAQVRYSQASVRNIQAGLAKTTLVAPVDGVISKLDIKVGEIATAFKSVVSIVSEAKFEIEANIPEVDIAQVRMGQETTITLDAYGPEAPFKATVTEIEPAETIVNNVTTYKVTFHFIEKDDRIKPGMTANITILADSQNQVLAIPQRAITKKGSQGIVRVLKDKTVEERLVITGLVATNGLVEVMAGVEEGEQVILSEIKK